VADQIGQTTPFSTLELSCNSHQDNQESMYFDNIVEFKAAILADKDRLGRAFAAPLLAAALGRAADSPDQKALDRIVRETAPEGFRIQDMIMQIVLSEPFQRKHSPAKLERAAL